ncbi:MAG: hypothetical protein IKW77_03375 [Salinivirgaceae bacterium]|nr:hypothetical protein [Salinivirgaceae bacterium]
MIRKPICWIPVAVSYAVLAWFVFLVVNPLCYNIFQQPAFVLTADFFWSKVGVPGGLSDYLQTFIDQFTMFRFWGTLFLVAEVFLTAFLTDRYVRKITCDNPFVSLLVYILPVAVSVVAWSDVKYSFAINMQVLLLAAVLNLHLILSKYDWHKYVTPLLAILVYHACGPVALYTFALCGILAYALKPDKRELVSVVGAVAVAALWPVLVYKFMLPIKPNAAFYDMRPQEQMFTSFKLTPALYMLYVSMLASMFIGYAYSKVGGEKRNLIITVAAVVVLVGCTVSSQKKHDKPIERIGFKMEVAAYNKDWNQILRYIKENKQLCERANYDRTVNFCYDWALAETNQLADRIFTYPQILGIDGLFLDRPTVVNVCLPVSLFYYNAGLISSALHYAFEAQTVYVNSHYLMRMVIDCLIIIGDYDTARLFLDKYNNEMFSKKYCADRLAFINGSHKTEFEKQNISTIRENQPKRDFYISGQQNNVLQLLLANRQNKIADQYLTCSALLQNDLDLFTNMLLGGYSNVSLNNLPRAYQEAVVLYKAMNKEWKSGIEKYNIQPYIDEQFQAFQKLVNSRQSNKDEVLRTRFGNTYWKYYFFDSPKVTGVSLK